MKVRLPNVPKPADLAPYDTTLLAEIYRRMFLIRQFEQKVNELFLKGIMPGTIHLSLGQEATTVGACLALEPDDVILTGTPEGISFVQPGDTLRVEVVGIGALENPIVAEHAEGTV